MTAATVDYLLDLPWFAVSDPDEPTPIYDALTAELPPVNPCGWCGAVGNDPCRTPSGIVVAGGHKGRG